MLEVLERKIKRVKPRFVQLIKFTRFPSNIIKKSVFKIMTL